MNAGDVLLICLPFAVATLVVSFESGSALAVLGVAMLGVLVGFTIGVRMTARRYHEALIGGKNGG